MSTHTKVMVLVTSQLCMMWLKRLQEHATLLQVAYCAVKCVFVNYLVARVRRCENPPVGVLLVMSTHTKVMVLVTSQLCMM